MQVFKLIAIWCSVPLVAFLMDSLTIKTVAFAVVCFILARVSVGIAEWLAQMAKQQNHGRENGRRVAVLLALCSFVFIVLSLATMIVAQVNYFAHWVA